MKTYYVYIMASERNGTLYIGVTNNLERRVGEHIHGEIEGFTKKYNVKLLVWFEETHTIEEAILKEKQIKEWQRKWKIELIEKTNPQWLDLSQA